MNPTSPPGPHDPHGPSEPPPLGGPTEGPGGEVDLCPRHPEVATRIRCQRCSRPVCPDCRRQAPVGFQCSECVRASSAAIPRQRAALGGVRIGSWDSTPVTYVLLGLCVAAWLLQLVVPGTTDRGSFVPALAASEPWRFLTSVFLHSPSGPTHLMMNGLALWMVGSHLERTLGQLRYLALFLVSGLGGSVGSLLLARKPDLLAHDLGDWFSPSVGASGAVFGLFAAMLVVGHARGESPTPMLVLLGINAVIGFVAPNIEWQAHLGGALTGLVLAWGMVRGHRTRRTGLVWGTVAAVLGLLVALSVWSLWGVPNYLG
ncbi:Membrane associated serine protease, rhomboid family [Kytococcus aerolatus]|uniref:Membrane associated serine protease, rhomboid family n=1 Tax=Kytococcus aerolatus TaxID=592308 RepID=A0A212TH60_9MICO|nr:rhomboid family intramembrane serine protease [Kytococcus aerolatus]SNC65171.1 Membrane associated serine protease, rhomboid family [Kytococcus aerolatus]